MHDSCSLLCLLAGLANRRHQHFGRVLKKDEFRALRISPGPCWRLGVGAIAPECHSLRQAVLSIQLFSLLSLKCPLPSPLLFHLPQNTSKSDTTATVEVSGTENLKSIIKDFLNAEKLIHTICPLQQPSWLVQSLICLRERLSLITNLICSLDKEKSLWSPVASIKLLI